MSFVAVAIGGAGVLGAGASIASSMIGANAAKSASAAQVNQEQQGLQLQQAQLGKLDPFINTGTQANYTLAQLTGTGSNKPDYSSFFTSPDYNFALTQGNNALLNYQNAMGLGKSGSGEAAALTFGQGLATQQYGNYFNRLMSLSQLGANAATAGVSGANGAASTAGAIGASTAGGITGTANAISSGLTGVANAGSGAANNALLFSAINRMPGAQTANSVSPSGYQPLPTTGSLPTYPAVPYFGQ